MARNIAELGIDAKTNVQNHHSLLANDIFAALVDGEPAEDPAGKFMVAVTTPDRVEVILSLRMEVTMEMLNQCLATHFGLPGMWVGVRDGRGITMEVDGAYPVRMMIDIGSKLVVELRDG